MKRPPGLWLLLSAGVLWLSMQDVYGIRATALIFGRGPTTTTTTEAAVSEESVVTESNKTNANSTQASSNSTSTNSTKPMLTGIPQIDYIYDPNLPRELNGYNLSEYPFYDRVPEDIEFKCDGLHDGFYASVPHKCQVYHHCLFGTRYDFLCANYTAFDQKTFICHFVSEVDCNNSHKFWHRNDALYVAATTTTPKPVFVPPPTTAPPPPVSIRPTGFGGGAGGRRRKPFRRPRPQYDYYYDDDYEMDYYEPPPRQRGRRKRPRPRPRPIYDDDYEEYEDDRYERRGGSGRRGEGNRRPYDDRREDEPYEKRHQKDERRHSEDKDEEIVNDRRTYKNEERRHDKRRPSDERNYENTKKIEKEPEDDEYYDDEPNNRRKTERPKKNKYIDDEEEPPRERPNDKVIVKPVSGGSIYNQPRKAPRIRPPVPKTEQNKYNYKSQNSKSATTTTAPSNKEVDESDYYEDDENFPPPPRPKPRPKASHSNGNTTKRPNTSSLERTENRDPIKPTGYGSRPRGGYRKPIDDDVEDDYEEEKPKPRRPFRYRPGGRNGGNRKRPKEDDFIEDSDMETAKSQNKPKSTTPSEINSSEESKSSKEQLTSEKEKDVKESTTKPSESGNVHHKPYVRVVKRPFLPSRGGNPYSSRGLKPVGSMSPDSNLKQTKTSEPEEEIKSNKDNDVKVEDVTIPGSQIDYTSERQNIKSSPSTEENLKTEISESTQFNADVEEEVSDPYQSEEPPKQLEQRPTFKPSPQIIKVPVENRYNNDPYFEEIEEQPLKSTQSRPQPIHAPNYSKQYSEPSITTNKPYYDDKSPLDISDESEYDVTLNEAINPTLPNLPIRNYPTGFSTSQDYSYRNIQRARANQNFKPSYQLRPTNHGTIIVPHSDQGRYVSAEDGFSSSLNIEPQVYRSQNFRSSPQVTQVRTQPYFSY